MKKPNETNMVYLNHLSGVWFFLFLCISGIWQSSGSIAKVPIQDVQRSALELEFFHDSSMSNITSRCSGTYVNEGRVLTAAHCFAQALEPFVKIKCYGRPWQTANLSTVMRHPEMDVAIAQFSDLDCDLIQIHPSAPSIKQQVTVFKHNDKQTMTVESLDAFTFKVSDTEACLSRGDSGMMAYAESFGAEPSSALGILISGQTSCPAIQTFLRFDLIDAWLYSKHS